MPESWEVKLNEFYKLLEGEEKSIKQGTTAVTAEPADTPKPEPVAAAPATEKPPAAKPWPPPILGLSKPEPEPVRAAAPAPEPVPEPVGVRSSGLPESRPVVAAASLEPARASVAEPAPSPRPATATQGKPGQLDLSIPKLEDFLPFLKEPIGETSQESKPAEQAPPPARPAQAPRQAQPKMDVRPAPEIQQAWDRLPKHIQMLVGNFPKETAQRYYAKNFRETREQLVQRLLDPPLTLEETARILNVCPMTVRRYTNRGDLPHFRTVGNQRRFRLSDVLGFLESRMGGIEPPRGSQGITSSA